MVMGEEWGGGSVNASVGITKHASYEATVFMLKKLGQGMVLVK